MPHDRFGYGSLPRWLVSLVPLTLIVLACGDDERAPTGGGSSDPMSFDVPADGTLGQVMAMVSAGDTIRVSGTNAVDATVTVDAALDGIVIVGRTTARGAARAVLTGAVGAGSVILVESGAENVEIRGLEITGTFGTGVRLIGGGATVADCWIEGATQFAVALSASADGLITRNILKDAGLFGVQCNSNTTPHILQNTIVGAGDCGIISSSASPLIEMNVIYGSANFGVACFGPALPTMSCNVIDESASSNYSPQCTPGPDDIEEDPLFCGDGTYRVTPASPCLPGAACGWIGAVHIACDVTDRHDGGD